MDFYKLPMLPWTFWFGSDLDPGLRPHDGLAMTIAVHEERNAGTVVSFDDFLRELSNSSSGPKKLQPYNRVLIFLTTI